MKRIVIFLMLISLMLSVLSCTLGRNEVIGIVKNNYGQPLANATVIMHSELQEAVTNEQGAFSMSVETGKHEMYAFKPGYFTKQEITVDNTGAQFTNLVLFPGFFSKKDVTKIYMLNQDSITINDVTTSKIQEFNYDKNTKLIEFTGKEAIVPIYDPQLTGISGIAESDGYIWVSAIVPYTGKCYLHRYDYDLNFQESFLFDNPDQYCSSRFLVEKDGYLIQDDVNYSVFSVGLRIYKIEGGIPTLLTEFSQVTKRMYTGCSVMDLKLVDNSLEIRVAWNDGKGNSYFFDVTDPANPTFVKEK